MRNLKKLGISLALLLTLFSVYFIVSHDEPYKPKVYDCFLFFNELELLEIRLNEMYDHVDKFVIVEACETFKGKPKPFFFAENRALFEKFADKIIHVTVAERLDTKDPWEREHFQRQQIKRGLKECRPDDIVFISDLDEIVRGNCISDIYRLIASKQMDAVVCQQKMYYSFLNRYQGEWPGTVCTTYATIDKTPMKLVRKLRNRRPRTIRRAHLKKVTSIPNAGWHFTSMGGVERQRTKIQAYSHKKLDNPQVNLAGHIRDAVNGMLLVEIDDTFPRFITENLSHFAEIGFIDGS